MSRIGSKPVEIISGVEISVNDNVINAKGSKGTLSTTLPKGITAKVEDKNIIFTPTNDSTTTKAMWGLGRSLVNNIVIGVSTGFSKKLIINGVGYKAQVKGKVLDMALGYSHPVLFDIPENIEIKTPKPTEIEITGTDKQKVGQVAAEIRAWKKPEPYKGKGIRYDDEVIVRKEGKKK